MSVTIDGTTGITSTGGYTGDGISFADGTPSNTLVTTTGGNVGIGTASPAVRLHTYAASGSNGFRMETASTTNADTNRMSFKNASGAADVRSGVIEWYDDTTFMGDQRFLKAGGVAWRNSSDAETLRITNGGTVVLKSGNTSATGTGITFPATQSTSSDANTLDDYEEGTFDVSIAFGGASVGVTYNNRTLSYTKIGNMVHVRGYLYLSNKGSSTGAATITGLPFAVKAGALNYATVSTWIVGITYSGILDHYVTPSNTVINLGQASTAGAFSTLQNTNFANTSEMMFTFSYATD